LYFIVKASGTSQNQESDASTRITAVSSQEKFLDEGELLLRNF